MKPYYENELGVIYHGDCLEILPQIEKVDLVLTDPPYNAKDIGPNKRKYIEGQMQLPEEKYKLFCRKWFDLSLNVCDRLLFTPGIANMCFYPQPYWVICWHKPAACSFNRMGGYNAWEPIFVYGKMPKGKRLKQDYILCNTLNFSKGIEKEHPCPKSPILIKQLIDLFSLYNDIILDPMCGSGTTLYLATKNNRRFIGIDKVEKYCEIAAKRCEQARTGLTPEEQEAGQKLLFVD